MKRAKGLQAILVAATAAMVMAATGCGSASAPSNQATAAADTVLKLPDLKGQTLVINAPGGSFGDGLKTAVVKPFEEATGAKVQLSNACCESFPTQVKAGQFAGDVVIGDDWGVGLQWAKDGLLKSDPRLAEIAKGRGVDQAYVQDNLVEVASYAWVLAWNTKNADNHPKTWAEFFDTEKFKGTRGLNNYGQGAIDVALLGSGVPADSLYPLDVDKGMAALTKLKENAPVHFWKNGADLMNQLGTGEIDYSLAWTNRVAAGIKSGLPVDMTYDGALRAGTEGAIPATAKNIDGAVAFLDFMMQPKISAAFSDASGMSPSVPAATDLIDEKMKPYMLTSENVAKSATNFDNAYWGENYTSVVDRFTKWLGGTGS